MWEVHKVMEENFNNEKDCYNNSFQYILIIYSVSGITLHEVPDLTPFSDFTFQMNKRKHETLICSRYPKGGGRARIIHPGS